MWVCHARARLGPLWRDLEDFSRWSRSRTDDSHTGICDCREEAEALPGKPSSDLARHGRRHTRPELRKWKKRKVDGWMGEALWSGCILGGPGGAGWGELRRRWPGGMPGWVGSFQGPCLQAAWEKSAWNQGERSKRSKKGRSVEEGLCRHRWGLCVREPSCSSSNLAPVLRCNMRSSLQAS